MQNTLNKASKPACTSRAVRQMWKERRKLAGLKYIWNHAVLWTQIEEIDEKDGVGWL